MLGCASVFLPWLLTATGSFKHLNIERVASSGLPADPLLPAQLQPNSSASFCECTALFKALLTQPFLYNHTGEPVACASELQLTLLLC